MSKSQVSAATRRDSAARPASATRPRLVSVTQLRPVSATRPPSEAVSAALEAPRLDSATRAIRAAGAAETRDSQAAVCRADSRVEARHSVTRTDIDSSRAADVAPADRMVTSPGTVPTRAVS